MTNRTFDDFKTPMSFLRQSCRSDRDLLIYIDALTDELREATHAHEDKEKGQRALANAIVVLNLELRATITESK